MIVGTLSSLRREYAGVVADFRLLNWRAFEGFLVDRLGVKCSLDEHGASIGGSRSSESCLSLAIEQNRYESAEQVSSAQATVDFVMTYSGFTSGYVLLDFGCAVVDRFLPCFVLCDCLRS